ncbi:Holliday junction resolvase RuvX [Proteiniclasticum sp. QWL-01]|uniref:Holliday junction resolvase RuvX n=1 Tax=Proteiniclasticum sp. QWL-01 TaxID=3036945 RepID=UPI0024115C30|nr:Holliday junction resolvase RuvX [Proteiniclasticum sp. QWL-01]WFF74490.1 Holliday junction resolvase RuvX [Proteiniclasticum sp. QWL-01]
MRVLSLDVGDRRIGVAVSDPTGFLATGLGVIKRDGSSQGNIAAVQQVLEQIKAYDVRLVVAGLPKNMDGTVGFQARKVLDFIEELKKVWDGEVLTWDERLTTVSAHMVMAQKKTKINQRKNDVDKIAACFILQGFLDSIEFKKRKEQDQSR